MSNIAAALRMDKYSRTADEPMKLVLFHDGSTLQGPGRRALSLVTEDSI